MIWQPSRQVPSAGGTRWYPAWPTASRGAERALTVLDIAVLYSGLTVSNGILTGQWMIPKTVLQAFSVGLVLAIYLIGIRLGGGYELAGWRGNRGSQLGVFVAGAGLAVTGIAFFWSSFPFTVEVMAVHVPTTLLGVLGLRGWLTTGDNSHHANHSPEVRHNDASGPEVQLDDLVSRPDVDIDRAAVNDVVSDRTVLVTGAGGSIGSHLTAQLRALSPARIVLVDINEHSLLRLKENLPGPVDAKEDLYLADVGNESEMASIISTTRPDIVFHTAAYKHVPLLERHPATAFRNNTLATVRLHELCVEHGVDTFVFVSTDKAVHPTSILGATKRWAECYLRSKSADVDTRTVRFGNVFGSEGSVVPRFQEKLAAGDPLPVTHPRMERYFMSADEACRLLLHTLLLEKHPTYLLRMGEPIRIQWLAEQLIERWYPQSDPSTMIEHVGRRAGEKLSEQLVWENESVQPTGHPRICGLESPLPFSLQTLKRHFEDLRAVCESNSADNERLRHLLLRDRPAARPSMA